MENHNHRLQTNPRQREEELQKINIAQCIRIYGKQPALSLSLFLITMTDQLERTLSIAYQNKDQTKNTMPLGGLKCILQYEISTLEFVVAITLKCLDLIGTS